MVQLDRKEYKDHYKRDLDADLKSELSSSEMKRAQELLDCKHVPPFNDQFRDAWHARLERYLQEHHGLTSAPSSAA